MKNKKILFIHHGQVLGGAPRSLKNTIIGLEKEEFDNLKILSAYPDMKAFFEEGTRVRTGDIYSPHMLIGRLLIGLAHWNNLRTLAGAIIEGLKIPIILMRQIKVLKTENPDIIHLNSSILCLVAISSKLLGIHIVWHIREVLIGGRWNIRKLFIGWLIRKLADEVICISEVEAVALGKNSYNNVHVVYNFIDFNEFFVDAAILLKAKKQYGSDTKKTVVSLGGISFRKGTVEIMQTAEKMTDVRFLIAGASLKKKHYSAAMRKWIVLSHSLEILLMSIGFKKIYSWYYSERVEFLYAKLNLSNLSFVGKIESVASLIAISDCLVFAGCTPHFPRPVYEAWAMKKPVIAFNMNGVRENITHLEDGIITEENTSKGLEKGIKLLLNNDLKSIEMGHSGYKKSLERFNMEVNVKKIITVYKAIICLNKQQKR